MIHIRKPSHIRKPLNGRELDRIIAYADDLIGVLRAAKEDLASTTKSEFRVVCHRKIRLIKKALACQWTIATGKEAA